MVYAELSKPGFYTCVIGSSMPSDVWTPIITTIPTFAIKACMLTWKSHMLNFSEGVRDLSHDMLWLQPIETNNTESRKIFCFLEKKSKNKEQPYNNDVQKVVVYNSVLDAFCNLHTSKCKRPHNKPYDVCLWKPAKTQ